MFIIGGLGSFAGASPHVLFFLPGLFCIIFWDPDPLTLLFSFTPPFDNSSLRSRDRCFPDRHGVLDWGTSKFSSVLLFSAAKNVLLKSLCAKMKQFRKQLKLVS